MDERLSKFAGKAKRFTHEESGLVVDLKPFKGKDLDVLLALGENTSSEDIINLITKALLNSDYSITKEEVGEEFTVSQITWLAECIGAINGSK